MFSLHLRKFISPYLVESSSLAYCFCERSHILTKYGIPKFSSASGPCLSSIKIRNCRPYGHYALSVRKFSLSSHCVLRSPCPPSWRFMLIRLFSQEQQRPNPLPNQKLLYAVYGSGVIGVILLTAIGVTEYKRWRLRTQGIEQTFDDLFGRRTPFINYKGYCLPGYVTNIINKLQTFAVREDDVFVISYPRSGTTWVQEIVYLIQNNLDFEDAANSNIEMRFSFLEYIYPGLKHINEAASPRLIKSHLPFGMLPDDIHTKKPKIIYICRNPKDVVLSFYHFTRSLKPMKFTGNLDQFCERFLSDKLFYGPWWRHVSEFWKHRHDDDILFLKYEDLKQNPREVINQIAAFLGKSLSNDDLLSLLQHTSFDYMKNNDSVNYKWWDDMGIRDKGGEQVLRKGVIGDWKNHLSPAISNQIDKMVTERFADTGLNFEYSAAKKTT